MDAEERSSTQTDDAMHSDVTSSQLHLNRSTLTRSPTCSAPNRHQPLINTLTTIKPCLGACRAGNPYVSTL
jgi:hypothetical protein